jgi:hypothetical protein
VGREGGSWEHRGQLHRGVLSLMVPPSTRWISIYSTRAGNGEHMRMSAIPMLSNCQLPPGAAMATLICGSLLLSACGAQNPTASPSAALVAQAGGGDAGAAAKLGGIYAHGLGVPQDDGEAVKWFRRAADQNDSGAQNDLGVQYELGLGVAHDDAQAARLYRSAANQGNAVAQGNIGRFYARGQGVPKDFAAARMWFERAARQGYPQAMDNLGRIYGEGDGVPADSAEALKWMVLAAGQYRAEGARAFCDLIESLGIPRGRGV